MANTNQPTGFAPVKNMVGNPWNQQGVLYFIPSSDGSIYAIGDAVKTVGGADVNGVQQVALAAAGNTLRGVIVGIVPTQAADPVGPIPATKLRNFYVYVADDPDILFEIQSNNAGAFTATNIGKNCNFVVAAGASPSPYSGTQVDSATFATTITLPLKVIGIAQRPGNDLTAFTKLLVKINQHELAGNTVGT